MRIVIVFLILLFQRIDHIYAQEEKVEADTLIRYNDILINTRFLDYAMEYYTIDDKNSFIEHHVLFQPVLNEKRLFDIEMSIVNSFQESGNHTTPGDLSVTYTELFASDKKGSAGYQGFAASLKLVLPTGRDEYLSGLDNWSIEPKLGAQWMFSNTNYFTSVQIRYLHNFAALPEQLEQPDFFRLEYSIVYETPIMWLQLEPDYRYIPSTSASTLFLGIDGGYKFNADMGVRAKWKPRLSGSKFFKSLWSAGIYAYL